MDARSACRPKVQAGSLAHAEKPPVRGGKLPAPAGGWALPAAAPALHEQMCISRLLRKSRQYLHSVERRRGGPSRAFPRLLRAAVPVEQGLCEGTALPVLCPPGAAAKKPVFQTDCTSPERFSSEPSSAPASASLCQSPGGQLSSGVQRAGYAGDKPAFKKGLPMGHCPALALRWSPAAPQPGHSRGGHAGLGLQTNPYFGDTSTAERAGRMQGVFNVSLLGPMTSHVGHHLGSRGNPSPSQ